jgi:ATP-dependent Lon protease
MPDAMISNEDVKQAIDRLLGAKPAGGAGHFASAEDPRQKMVVARETILADGAEPATSAKLAIYRSLNSPLAVSPPPGIAALDALRKQAPHTAPVLDALSLDMRFLAKLRAPSLPAQHILLWGPAGCGKTWLGRRLLDVLSSGAFTYSAGGMSSAVDLVGHPRSFRDSDAGLPVRAIARTGIANPAILMDEFDKTTSSHNGDARMAALAFLERETSARLFDPFLQVHVDCSRIHWVFTANDISSLPEPLLSRLNVFELPRPGEEALDALVAGFSAALADEFGMPRHRLAKVDELLRLKVARLLRSGEDLRVIRAMFNRELKQRALAEPKRRLRRLQRPAAN